MHSENSDGQLQRDAQTAETVTRTQWQMPKIETLHISQTRNSGTNRTDTTSAQS